MKQLEDSPDVDHRIRGKPCTVVKAGPLSSIVEVEGVKPSQWWVSNEIIKDVKQS